MIIKCPFCRGDNDLPDGAAAAGKVFVCARCSKGFRLVTRASQGATPGSGPPAGSGEGGGSGAPSPGGQDTSTAELENLPTRVLSADDVQASLKKTLAGDAPEASSRQQPSVADAGTAHSEEATAEAPAFRRPDRKRPDPWAAGEGSEEKPKYASDDHANIVTDVLSMRALRERLEEMNQDDGGPFEDEGPGAPALPSEPLQSPPVAKPATGKQRVGRGPLKLTAASLVIVAVAAALFGLKDWRRDRRLYYVGEDVALLASPVPDDATAQLGTLTRGEIVKVFAYAGPFAVLRDVRGRIGYVVQSSLVSDRPQSLPNAAFVGCVWSPVEDSAAACQARAQQQLESCRNYCEREADSPECFTDCAGHASTCVAGCDRKLEFSTAGQSNAADTQDGDAETVSDDSGPTDPPAAVPARADDPVEAAASQQPTTVPPAD